MLYRSADREDRIYLNLPCAAGHWTGQFNQLGITTLTPVELATHTAKTHLFFMSPINNARSLLVEITVTHPSRTADLIA